jgi:hypothetical protein
VDACREVVVKDLGTDLPGFVGPVDQSLLENSAAGPFMDSTGNPGRRSYQHPSGAITPNYHCPIRSLSPSTIDRN